MPSVRLERMGAEHLDATLAWLQDSELRAAIGSVGPPDPEVHPAYWARRHASVDEESYAVLADGRHVGNCGLLLDPEDHTAELWLYLGDRVSRGAGIGTQTAKTLLDRAFEELGLGRAKVRVLKNNSKALRFWQSIGFVDAGEAEDHSIWLTLGRPAPNPMP